MIQTIPFYSKPSTKSSSWKNPNFCRWSKNLFLDHKNEVAQSSPQRYTSYLSSCPWHLSILLWSFPACYSSFPWYYWSHLLTQIAFMTYFFEGLGFVCDICILPEKKFRACVACADMIWGQREVWSCTDQTTMLPNLIRNVLNEDGHRRKARTNIPGIKDSYFWRCAGTVNNWKMEIMLNCWLNQGNQVQHKECDFENAVQLFVELILDFKSWTWPDPVAAGIFFKWARPICSTSCILDARGLYE